MVYCSLIFQTERDLKNSEKNQKPQASFKVPTQKIVVAIFTDKTEKFIIAVTT